jgi:hypothetical protein
LSPNIHLHSTALICKRPENPDAPAFRRGWHRDIRIPEDLGNSGLPRVGIQVCYCLTDFHRADAGMTLMARGTHLRQEPLVIRRGESDPEGVEVCDLRLDAGDALLFENRIFHTAAPNRRDRVSRVIIYGYAYRWMKPEVYLDPPDERHLAGANLILRQLLGGYRDIDTPPWALQEWARQRVVRERVPWAVDAPGGAGMAFSLAECGLQPDRAEPKGGHFTAGHDEGEPEDSHPDQCGAAALGSYSQAIRVGNLVFVTGQTGRTRTRANCLTASRRRHARRWTTSLPYSTLPAARRRDRPCQPRADRHQGLRARR